MRNPSPIRRQSNSREHDRRHSAATLSAGFVVTLLMTGCVAMPKFPAQSEYGKPGYSNSVPPAWDDDDDTNAVAAKPWSNRSSKKKSSKRRSPQKVAGSNLFRGLLATTKPFAWESLGTTAGRRDIQGISIGQGGYRVLVLGSLGGNDPLAITLAEQLADHVHRNQILLGGIRLKVVRNCNPDGHAELQMENANGVYLNRQFRSDLNARRDLAKQEPEVRFVLGLLEEDRPQRVIHIRTTSDRSGKIAASSGAADAARDFSDWLNFDFIALPGPSAEGTLERYLSQKSNCEIVTVAIPDTSDRQTLWQTYGDSLLNLLLAEDFATRKLAREQKNSVAADRRGHRDEGFMD